MSAPHPRSIALEVANEVREQRQTARRSLGISAPEGTDVYEVYVKVRSKTMGLCRLIELVGSANAEVLGAHVDYSTQDRLSHVVLYLEMCNAKTRMEDLLWRIKAQELVLDAVSESKSSMHFESMLFPIVRGGSYRVFVLGADEWVNLLEAFAAKFGTAAAALFHEQGVSIGEVMAARLEDRFTTKPTAEAMERDFVGLIRAAGMGRLRLSGTRFGFVVKIEDSIAGGSNRHVIDNFLVGVVTGALGRIHSSTYAVSDLAQSRDSGITFCLNSVH